VEERERRIGINEGLFREVNERIEQVTQRLQVTSGMLAILCECGDESCTEQIEIRVDEYERGRADGAMFFVRPGHEVPDTEDVVEEHEAYYVVRKKPDGPAELARDLDPRS
jgi:hypothetical protein